MMPRLDNKGNETRLRTLPGVLCKNHLDIHQRLPLFAIEEAAHTVL